MKDTIRKPRRVTKGNRGPKRPKRSKTVSRETPPETPPPPADEKTAVVGRPEGSYNVVLGKRELEQVESLAGYGLTEGAIAVVMGMDERTFRRRKHAQPELVTALRAGKALAEASVGQALYKLATGIKIKVVRRDKTTNKIIRDPETGEPITDDVYTRIPDIKAIRWYEMTRGGRRAATDTQVSGPGGGPIPVGVEVERMTAAQKVARFKDLLDKARAGTNGNGKVTGEHTGRGVR